MAGLKLMGIHGRVLPSPEFRMYTNDSHAARTSFEEIARWPFERILPAHGAIIEDGAREAFREVTELLCREVAERSATRQRLYDALAKWQ